MNKIIIVYDSPFQYFWDGNLYVNTDDTINYLLDLKINNFDIVETILDIDHFKELYYAKQRNCYKASLS